MSMVLFLRSVSDKQLKDLLNDPESINELLDEEADEDEDDFVVADLDKAWQAVHFLLTGTASEGTGPEAFLLAGGTTIGDVDVGYGPARGFTSAETSAIAAMLERFPAEKLGERFDGPAMDKAEVYPANWSEEGEEVVDYILEQYDYLCEFVSIAAGEGNGMIVYIG